MPSANLLSKFGTDDTPLESLDFFVSTTTVYINGKSKSLGRQPSVTKPCLPQKKNTNRPALKACADTPGHAHGAAYVLAAPQRSTRSDDNVLAPNSVQRIHHL